MTRLTSLAAVVLVSSISLSAHAGDAWNAAKTNLAKGTTVLIGMDIGQLKQSSMFQLGFPMLMAQQPDAKAAFDLLKSECKIDPLTTVKDLVIAADADQTHGAIYLSVTGLDQAKLVSCLDAVSVAKGKKDAKTTVVADGKITELGVGDKKLYVSWLTKTVIAVPLDFTGKKDLQAWVGAKGLASSKVARGAGKVNTGSALWVVSGTEKKLDDSTTMKTGYGSVALSAGTLSADFHVQLDSAKSAKDASMKAQTQLDGMANNPGLDPSLKKILTSVKVTAANDEMAIKGSMPENELMSVVMALKP